ncbi:MAG: hypothetical protein NW207_02640 [Cytophagales bacterium]|nr:hypothetical protein [Cytophagales bacterium]
MQANDNQDIHAFFITFFVHTLLIIFLFIFMLRTPIPPFSGGQGVVLNLGFVDEGTGEVQTYNEPSDSPITEENKPIENTETPVEPNPQPPVEDNTQDEPNDDYLTSDADDNDVKANDNKLEEPKPKNETPKPVTVENKPATDNIEKYTTKVTPDDTKSGKTGQATNGGNNNGDKTDKVGDQGNPQGQVDARALYGNPGTGGDGQGGSGNGSMLDMAGWKWQAPPRVKDEDENENGKIVFQVTIDSEGEIVNIKTLEKTVSPATEKLYRSEVEKLSFIKTDNKIPAATSTGRITFIIRSR